MKIIFHFIKVTRITPLLTKTLLVKLVQIFLIIIDTLFLVGCLNLCFKKVQFEDSNIEKKNTAIIKFLAFYMEIHRWFYFIFKIDLFTGEYICSLDLNNDSDN